MFEPSVGELCVRQFQSAQRGEALQLSEIVVDDELAVNTNRVGLTGPNPGDLLEERQFSGQAPIILALLNITAVDVATGREQ
jgi:hypothetical protein